MESITQMALGAAVGEAVLGKQVGNKAPLWGAVAGLIPDLDIAAGPFLDTIERISSHRSITHSILFSILLAPAIGYLITRIYRGKEGTYYKWTILSFLALFTHSLLDCFTTYGTQLFQPFSDYRVSFDSIFIIDPVYSVPLIFCVIALLFFNRISKKRQIINYIGLGLSSLYLLLTVINKIHINSVFAVSLNKQNILYNRYVTTPTPLNNILWYGVFESDNGYWMGYYSLLDKDREITFHFAEKYHHLIDNIKSRQAIGRLIWFSKGFYNIEEKNGFLYFNDLRSGPVNGWIEENRDYVFSYKIIKKGGEGNTRIEIEPARPFLRMRFEMFSQLIERIKGI